MPSRLVCLGVILFWLGFNGWLFFRDLLPRMLPGQPPPYTIDLVEETRQRRPYIDWAVHHEERLAFRARTAVVHPEHDVYELTAEFTTPYGDPPPMHGFQVRRMTSTYRVNSVGDLLGMAARVEARPALPGILKPILSFLPPKQRKGMEQGFSAAIRGEVEGGLLALHATVTAPSVVIERDLATLKVPSGAAVLLPLHPVNRVQGIRLGQTWTLHVFDPIRDLISNLAGGTGEPRPLLARVRDKTETFTYGRRRDVECLVIDYDGDGFRASTWVAKERGLVMCQEAWLDNQRWAMYRD